jgi:uncharacterized protein (TIGR03067 family)
MFSGLTVLAALFMMSADTLRQASKEDDVEALQGIWVLQTVEQLGEKTDQNAMMDPVDLRREYLNSLPEERELNPDAKKYRSTLTIKENTFVFREMGRTSAEGQFKLHVDKKPKVMKRRTIKFIYHIHEASWSVFSSEDTYYSIYSIEGDTLKWCYRQVVDEKGLLTPGGLKDLPAKFATDRDEEVFLLTFKRER